jgi:autotransporter-associated beta strand protein
MARWGYLVAAATAFVGLANGVALAQVDYANWNPALTGNQLWQVDGNWSPATFPNDPDRVDANDMTILNVVGANVSVGLGSNLNLSVGESDVTVAVLKVGGTSGPVMTTISAGVGGRLVMENNENNYVIPSPTPGVPDTVTPSYNRSNALIVSGGVAGSTNVISAPLVITDVLDIGSYETDLMTNDLTISGEIKIENTTRSTVLNLRAAGRTLTITGDQVIPNVYAAEGVTPDLAFNDSTDSTGTIVFQGDFSGPGMLQMGPRPASSLRSTYVIESDNALLAGGVTLGLGDFFVKSDTAFGTGTLKQNSATNSLGVNLISDNDTRVIAAPVQLAQFVTIKGEHSLTVSGEVTQTNARGWVNLLPAGKTFTLSGAQYADDQEIPDFSPIPVGDNPYYFDGTGKTVVTGALHGHRDEPIVERSFGKRGTGSLYLQGSLQDPQNVGTYSGFTYIQGGNLHAATLADFAQTQKIKSTGGAIGLDNGTVTGPDSAGFLALLNNRAQAPAPGNVGSLAGDLKRTDDFASGGLMLSASESAANLNFTAGSLANAADMSVAAPEQGMTYTGTVTPANNTYRFGGGAGVITLPNANQLTGANSLVVMNGHDLGDRQGLGGVRVTANNNYSGVTRIQGRTMLTNQDAAASNGGAVSVGQYNGTTLTVTSLANGGVASGIGASTNAGSNLHLQGGTLRYEGAATSTDRLFTIGTRGATLDASGSGALVFNNTGALTIDTAEARTATVNGSAFAFQTGTTPASNVVAFNVADTSDIVPGMRVSASLLTESPTDTDTTITVTAIQSPTRFVFSDLIGPFVSGTTTFSFVDVERTFTLTGSSTANNTLRPIIADSATNVVNVAKTGSGKWILDAVNTYTGDTSVEAGVLSITKSYLSDTADVMIDSGAIFDLSFVGSDTIGALFLDGASQGLGTYGSLASSAMFKSSYFTGTGILNVTELVLTAIPGDYNNDGIVNAADYTVYRDKVGQPGGTLVNDPAGGVVGAAQYTQWANNYGATEPPASLSLSVPEPTALLLAGIAAAGLLSRRKSA